MIKRKNIIKIAIDSPEVNLIFPINDPLDPTNFSLGLIDFNLPLNIQNNKYKRK